jgi:hypothetical protein
VKEARRTRRRLGGAEVEQDVHCRGQIRAEHPGDRGGAGRAEPYGGAAGGQAGLYVSLAVADHDAVREPPLGEVSTGLQEQAREWLAAGACAGLVRANIKAVDPRPDPAEAQLEGIVDPGDLLHCHLPEGDAPLVGDDKHWHPGVVQPPDRCPGTRQEPERPRRGDVTALGSLGVDRPVAVEEDGIHLPRWQGEGGRGAQRVQARAPCGAKEKPVAATPRPSIASTTLWRCSKST